MKKIFTVVMALCLMVGAFCITSSAETEKVVIRVAGMTENGSIILPEPYTSFKDGWNRAADLAQKHEWMDENGIVRIVVDLYDDWNAPGNGKFGSGTGFEHDTIRVPGGTKMMINMNGHSINRGKTSYEYNGEVIFMGKKSELVINGGQYGDEIVKLGEDPGTTKMGTIKGGYSCSGAGGIHMDGNGRLILNNVHISGNKVVDDDGAAIAAFNDSVVIMNGGSISNNMASVSSWGIYVYSRGALFLSGSTATLNGVDISHNGYKGLIGWGYSAIYAKNSSLTMNDCYIGWNNRIDGENNYGRSCGTIATEGSSAIIEAINCKFEDNGEPTVDLSNEATTVYSLFMQYGGTIRLTDCDVTNNSFSEIFYGTPGIIEATNTSFTANRGLIVNCSLSEGSYFTNCTFSDNHYKGNVGAFFSNSGKLLTLTDCDFDGSVVNSDKKISVVDTDALNGAASIISEGSINMILVVIALIASAVSISLTVVLFKRTAHPVAAAVAPVAIPATAKVAADDDEDDE